MTEGCVISCFSFCAAVGQLLCMHVCLLHFFWPVIEFNWHDLFEIKLHGCHVR